MDDTCPICLQAIHNVTVLDGCKHIFCKKCIMEWMKKTDSCPLCKTHVKLLISDILTPSHYSKYLPNGKHLYSKYCPNRRAIYTLNLENSPHYEKEVLPNDLQNCSFLKDWLEREIASILPGVETSFFTSMILEGLSRYGSRDEKIQARIQDVIGSYATLFIRELENFVFCNSSSLEEYDFLMTYHFPSLAESTVIDPEKIDYDNTIHALIEEKKRVEHEIEELLGMYPEIEEKAKNRRKELAALTWEEKTIPKRKQKYTINNVPTDDYVDYQDWDFFDYSYVS